MKATNLILRKKPKKKVPVALQRKPVTHKRRDRFDTECGISLHDIEKSNATWRGVTCLRCKATTTYKDYMKKQKGGK